MVLLWKHCGGVVGAFVVLSVVSLVVDMALTGDAVQVKWFGRSGFVVVPCR